MPRLKYIGPKIDGERNYIVQTGITWLPGDEHEVSLANAELMLKHVDMWDLVEPAITPEMVVGVGAEAMTNIASGASTIAKIADEAIATKPAAGLASAKAKKKA